MRTRLLPRAAMLLGAAGLLLSLAMLARIAWTERRTREALDARFQKNAAGSGVMVDIAPAFSVAAFSIDETEVTVAAYRACVEAGACTLPTTSGLCNWDKADRDDHPANCVDWFQATAFCAWAGKRLPTSAEWQLAGCGVGDGAYPWGREPPAAQECFARAAVWESQGAIRRLSRPDLGTCPVRRHPASARRLFDMGGNVAEWTSSELVDEARGSNRPIHLGATWGSEVKSSNPGMAKYFQCDVEEAHAASYRSSLLGFRCARDAAE